MSKLNHTHGPWVLCRAEEYPWLLGDVTPEYRERTLTILGSDGYGVLSVPISITDNYPESPMAMANARLIAASPDMLDALIRCFVRGVEGIGMSKSEQRRIRSLIESATGLPIEEVLK